MAGEIFDAIRNSDLSQVALLVGEQPARAHERNASGVSAIMQARYQGQRAIVDVLRPFVGELDVFEASALGDVERLKSLLAANPGLAKTYSGDGFTPLHLASYFGQPEAAAELLRHGADANAVATNGTKLAVINSAAASGDAGIVRILLRAGAKPNVQQEGGYTALHSAAQRNNAEMVRALLEAGADPAIPASDGKLAADMAGAEVATLLGKS